MSKPILHDYWRSTASYRVRIVLNLAEIEFEKSSVDLLNGGQNRHEYLKINPQGFVPGLEIDGIRLTQSLAIIEYLNETRSLNLLPDEPIMRAKSRALAQIICCDTHPVCNPSVVSYALQDASEPDEKRKDWMQHFIRRGLVAFEHGLPDFELKPFTNGENFGLPEVCLMPQLYNANRWGVSYSDLKVITQLEQHCAELEVFNKAAPR